jgi:hypothetical protein
MPSFKFMSPNGCKVLTQWKGRGVELSYSKSNLAISKKYFLNEQIIKIVNLLFFRLEI